MNTSKCCKAKLNTICADEGTCHYECSKCGDACDVSPVSECSHEWTKPKSKVWLCSKCRKMQNFEPVSEQKECKCENFNKDIIDTSFCPIHFSTPQKEEYKIDDSPITKQDIKNSKEFYDNYPPLENDWKIIRDEFTKWCIENQIVIGKEMKGESIIIADWFLSKLRHQKELSFKEGARIEKERIIKEMKGWLKAESGITGIALLNLISNYPKII